MQNAEGKMQIFLGDGVIEVQTVGETPVPTNYTSSTAITRTPDARLCSHRGTPWRSPCLACGLGHISALALLMQFTTETPLLYPKGKVKGMLPH